MADIPKKRVLILSTANSARSQMAEGILRWLGDDRDEVFSAGAKATSVNPFAIRVMDEIGVDIRSQYLKTCEQFIGQPFDAVITVCDDVVETCPFLPDNYRLPLGDSRRGCGDDFDFVAHAEHAGVSGD